MKLKYNSYSDGGEIHIWCTRTASSLQADDWYYASKETTHTAKPNSKLLAILDMLKDDGFLTQEVGQVAKCIPRLPMCSVFTCSALDDDCNIQ